MVVNVDCQLLGEAMDKDELIDKLLEELSSTQVVMAKQVYRFEGYLYKPRSKTVAKNWLERAETLNEKEWTAGARSLSTYFLITDPVNGEAAKNILQPFSVKYAQSRKGKYQSITQPTNDVENAKGKLRNEYLRGNTKNENKNENDELKSEPNLHGATTRAYPQSNRMTSPWKSKYEGVKTWFKSLS